MNRIAQTTVRKSLILSVIFASVPVVRAQNFDLSWFTIDAGGDMFASGGEFELAGTVGQPACPGDFNCDGKRDLDDIDPFVLLLVGG